MASGNQGNAGSSVVPEPFYKGWIGSDGVLDAKAYDRLPPELAPFKDSLAKYRTVPELIGAFVHSQSLNGKKGLMALPPNASEADRAIFNSKMRELNGVPEKVEGYGVEKPKDVPDDQWNGEYVNSMVGILHKHNVSPAAVKELLAADQQFAIKARTGIDAAKNQTFENTRTKVVQAFGNNFDQQLGLAKRMATTMGLNMQDPAIGNNADLIIGLAKAAAFISEDKLVKGSDGGAPGTNDREKARSIVFEKSNPLYEAYHDARHPMHSSALQQVATYNESFAKLQKQAS